MKAVHISGATILDGSGRPPYRGDLLLSGQSIADAGRRIEAPSDAERIDAAGLYAAPGFIDAHSHTDLGPFLAGGMTPSIQQGITTAVVGQCGFSPAPMPPERQEGWSRYCIIAPGGAARSWHRFGEYLEAVRAADSPVNFLPFVGHGTLRFAVKGDDPAPCSAAERQRICALLREACGEGARGLSLGLIYVPALFADRRELRELLGAAAKLSMPVTVHLRSESDELLQALAEILRLGRESGARIHIAHLKTIGTANRYKMAEALYLIERGGLSFDTYPYPYGSTSLLTLLPPAPLRGRATDEVLSDLESPAMRERILPYLRGRIRPAPGEPWDNLAQLVGWEGIEIVDLPKGPYSDLQGLTLAEAAERLSRSPEETVLRLLSLYGGRVRIIDRFSAEETMLQALLHPAGVCSTDTLLGGRLHPRSAGAFPRVLRRYVFDRGLLPPEEAAAKMSGRSARLFGMDDRGILAPGKRADLILFSPQIADHAVPENPEAPPQGVERLFICGKPVLPSGLKRAVKSDDSPTEVPYTG